MMPTLLGAGLLILIGGIVEDGGINASDLRTVGLMVVIGIAIRITRPDARRDREAYDEGHRVGYRLGHRAGRRCARPVIVPMDQAAVGRHAVKPSAAVHFRAARDAKFGHVKSL